MTEKSVSESEFILIELRYTVAQVDVQLAALPADRSTRASEILDRVACVEREYQRRYAEELGLNDAGVTEGASFASTREATMELLRQVPEPWPQSLLDLAHAHLRDNRGDITELANLRVEDHPAPA